MDLIVIIPPNEFKDETVSQVCTTLDKWKVNYKISSTSLNTAKGTHGAIIRPNIRINEISSEDYEGIILLNGLGIEEYKLYDSRVLIDLIKHFNDNQKLVAGLGNALKIIARSNIITNKKICKLTDSETTRYVSLFKGIMTDNQIERDNNLITASKSDNAFEFSKLIIESLGLS
ncbi:MAG: DJ-1/PfpI family protein [Candidatus Micrarchaeaceae archaeon]